VGFETTLPVFERAKTFHASDRAAAVIGKLGILLIKKKKLRGFSPQANYTDRAIAACQRS
jgi:hypothetical protein